MRYVGGKSRLARAITAEIRRRSPNAVLAVEPFMGGGAVTEQLVEAFEEVRASDSHPDLILLWQAVLDGWEPPEVISTEEYQALRASPHPSALRGLAGFGGSYGGAWFRGYARGGVRADGQPRNHQGESSRAVARIGRALRSGRITVEQLDYQQVEVPDGAVVYADPPYAGTLGFSTGDFDSAAFWRWAAALSERSDVYVSEYAAPPGWESIWSASKRQSVTLPSQGRALVTEHLFTYRPA